MEQFLVSAARRQPRRSRPTRRALVAGAAGGAALAVAIAIAVASNGTSGAPGRAVAGPVHVHLVDFSVDTNPGGTVTVILGQAQMVDPDALRQALAQAGIPARITVGKACQNVVQNRNRSLEAFALSKPGPGEASKLVITPSKLPPGSTLTIGYVMNGAVVKPFFSVLAAGAPVTCTSSPPPASKGPDQPPPPASKDPTVAPPLH
jgi:hypothetical protein